MFFLSIIFFQLIFSLSPKNQLSVIESMLKRDTDFEVFAEHIQSIGSIDSGSPIELILTNQYTTREVFCHVGDEVPSDHPLYCFSEKSLKNSKKTTMSTGLLWRENAINEYVGGLNLGDLIVVYLDPNRNLMGSSQKKEGLNQDTSLRMVYLGNGKVLVKLTDKGGFYVYPLSYFEKMRGEEIDKHIFRQIDRLEIWTQQSY